MNNKPNFSKWLFKRYVIWEYKQGKPQTITDFARATGVSRQTIDKLLSTDKQFIPKKKTINALAKVIGDGIFTYFDMEKPSVDLIEIERAWDQLPENLRRHIYDLAIKHSAEDTK